jgi:hypothetical protein
MNPVGFLRLIGNHEYVPEVLCDICRYAPEVLYRYLSVGSRGLSTIPVDVNRQSTIPVNSILSNRHGIIQSTQHGLSNSLPPAN